MTFFNPLLTLFLVMACSVAQAEVKRSSFRADPEGLIIDQAGRRMDVRPPFKRIISLYGGHTENLFALGLDAEIVGVSRNEVYPEKALTKPVFSYHDDPEKFMAARPDLVLVRPMIDRGYPQLVKRLEENSITVVSLQPGAIDEMFLYWEILGRLTGKQERAAEMIAHFKKEVENIRSLTTPVFPKKRGYFEAIHRRMKTFSPEAMAIFVLESAGGINVARDAKPVRGTNIAFYGKEKILSHAKEIDVFIAQKGAMNRPTRSLLKNEPGFSAIKAIRDGQILIIDEMIVSRPTLRLLQGVRKIGHFLYPALIKGDNH